MQFFSNIYGILFRPNLTLENFNREFNYSLLIQALLAYFLSTAIVNNLDFDLMIESFFSWLFATTLIFIGAYIFKLNIKDYPRVLCLSAFANLPLIFLTSSKIISELYPSFGGFLGFLILLWSFNLNLIALSHSLQVSKFKIALLYLLPVLLLIFALITLITGVVTQFIIG